MLRYLATGLRRFGTAPIPPFARFNWEFYAVIEGECGIVLENDQKGPLQRSHLWITAPNHVHGWYGNPKKPCIIVAFHFGSVPEPFAELVHERGLFEKTLRPEECEQLQLLEKTLRPESAHTTFWSALRCERSAIDLTLLAVSDLEDRRLYPLGHKNAEKVGAALAWFDRHRREHPTLQDVARAVHVSVSHLRRLFAEVRGETPSEAIACAKIEAAIYELTHSDAKLETIAVESGFRSASDFSRAFKARTGCSPRDYRRIVPPYSELVPEPQRPAKRARG